MKSQIDTYLEHYGYVRGEMFYYTFAPMINLLATTDRRVSVTIDADLDFCIESLLGQAFTTPVTAAPQNFLVNFQDSSTSKFYFSQNTLSLLCLTTAEDQEPKPLPRLAPMKTTITASVFNTVAGAVAIDVYLTLRGYKIYNKTTFNEKVKGSGINQIVPSA